MNKAAVNHVIDAFGGVHGMIHAAGEAWALSATNIYKWRSVGRIPQSWHAPILMMAKQQGVELDQDTLLAAMGIKSKVAA